VKQKKIFVTYGSDSFSLQKKHLKNLAITSGIFDEVIAFSPADLPASFKTKYRNYLNVYRGGGYWIWKSEIMRMVLSQLNENDLIVYSSSGSSFNKNGLDKFKEYINLLNESNKISLRFAAANHIEKNWTTKEIFNYFNLGLDSKIANSDQLIANHFILKKNKDSIELFEKFNQLLEKDSKLITHHYDKFNQIDTFCENRNDQSIFSVLNKIYGAFIIPRDETFYSAGDPEQYNFPFLSVRKRQYTIYQKIKFYLNYKQNINSPIFFEDNRDLLQRFVYKIFKTKI